MSSTDYTKSEKSMEREISEHLQKNEESSAVNADLNATEAERLIQCNEPARNEQEIRESEERFRGIFNSSLVGIAITDSEGRWLYFNEKLCIMLGFSASELRTKTWGDLTPPEDLIQEIEIFKSVLAGKQAENIEKQYIRKDKSLVDVIVSTGIVRNPDGTIAYFSSVILDITARKRSETALIYQNEKLQAAYEQLTGAEEELKHQYDHLAAIEENHRKTIDLLENLVAIANVPIIVWDSEFRVVRMNRIMEQITGRSASACIGSPFQSLFSSELADRVNRLLETTHSGVKWESVELPVLHLDGSYRIILWNTTTLFDTDGITPVATLAQGKDVTDERRYAAEKDAALVEIQKKIAQLAILNDEIRNPLAIIVTYADLLGTKELINQIQAQAKRIDEMVANLDQRWAESEKVLDVIRRYYHIEVHTSSNFGLEDGNERSTFAAGIEKSSSDGDICNSLMEEVQAQLYTILDSIDAFVYVADMQTYDLLYMNQQGRAYLGNTVGKKCYQVLYPGRDTPCSFCTNKYLMDNSRPTGVYRWECEDTQQGRWFDCRDRAIRWSDGRWVRLEIATDITELRLAEQAIRVSGEKYRLLADNIGDVIWTAGEEMHITYVSPSITSLTGYTPDEWMHLHPQDRLTPESVDQLAQSRREFLTLISAGTIDQFRPTILELEFRTKDGSSVVTETTIRLIFSSEDGPRGVVGVTRDITARKRAEEALIENENRYREIFESLDDLHYQTDESGTIALLSPSVYQLSGWSIDDLVGTPVRDLYINPEDRNILLSKFSQKGYVKDYELLLRKKDGMPIPISLSGSVMRNPDGTLKGVRGSLRDISRRKRVEEALRESESRFRSYIDNAPDGVFLANENGDYSFVNNAACGITGYSCKELLQKNLLDLTYPDDINLASAHFQNLAKKGISSGELRFVTREGDIRWWMVKAVRLSPVQFLGFTSDITDRKHTELALLESELRYRMLIDKANEGILIAQDGTFVLVNQRLCDILGVSEEDLVGRSFLDFIYSEDREMVMSNYLKRIAGETVLEGYEFRIIGEGGRLRWVFLSSALIQWNGRNATLNLVTDFTRRKEAEEALYSSNQKLRLLTGLTRHDVINKLSAIHLLHDLAKTESDSGKRDTYLSQASEATQEVEAIIRFTREYEDFGVVSSRWQQVQSIVLHVSLEIGHHGILIETTISPDIEIFADPIIRKVFSSLIENAIRHGRDLTRIIFSCYQEERHFVIVCEDDGCGIPVEEKERVFDHGYGKNTGLGLFLSCEILAINGLSIRETGKPGKGARFEIMVPEGKWRRAYHE